MRVKIKKWNLFSRRFWRFGRFNLIFKQSNRVVCHFEEREITLEARQRLALYFAESRVRFLVPRDDKIEGVINVKVLMKPFA
ncbi:hypothetical protein AR687_18995 [Flavobacteriaceae bacterium CRH]|nr:hypothetical protein AR687_18995 [Flavobacteriaceae bacterium CRH]